MFHGAELSDILGAQPLATSGDVTVVVGVLYSMLGSQYQINKVTCRHWVLSASFGVQCSWGYTGTVPHQPACVWG